MSSLIRRAWMTMQAVGRRLLGPRGDDDSAGQPRAHRWFGLGMLVLGVGLAVNTLLGPLVADVIDYPFSETVRNETLGLEAVTLVLVAPLAMAAGFLAWRGHSLSAVLALGPTAYAAYMLVQYVIGPQYLTFQPAVALHLGLLILSLALLVRAWTLVDANNLPERSRGWAIVVFLLAAFVVSRWSGAISGLFAGGAVPAAPEDVTMYWSIVLLDLGIVVPTAIATGVGLLMRHAWATKALYGVVGWFALVPPSIAAMAMVKVLRDDPLASTGDVVVLVVAALVFGAVAARLYVPLWRLSGQREGRESTTRLPAAEGAAH